MVPHGLLVLLLALLTQLPASHSSRDHTSFQTRQVSAQRAGAAALAV